MTATDAPYSETFFRRNAMSAADSAAPVLGIVHSLYQPTSIVDVGCGSGGWLAAAEQLGFTVLRGYDGPWADPAKYTSPNIDFRPVNLEEATVELDRRFDLAMSVEVAEHLSESRADIIVDLLCAASDVVLFGAAIPQQGGTHHINEQPQTYWIAKFASHGYEPFDVIRPQVWDNDKVRDWFRQNTLLYVKEGSPVPDREVLRSLERPLWNAVHPVHYSRKARKLRETTTELRNARKQIAQLQASNEKLQRRANQLEAQLRSARPRRRTLRQLRPNDLPAPLRPMAIKAWRHLPPSVRQRVRGR